MDSKEIQPIHSKGNQSWVFFGRTDAETPILRTLVVKPDPLEKTLMLGKIEAMWRRGWQKMQCVGGSTDSVDMDLSKL